MTITVGGTSITFNDATTQSTAATGTVSSIATGNGLSGGTITSTGTLTIAAPSANSVGSYADVDYYQNGASTVFGDNRAVGGGNNQIQGVIYYDNTDSTWGTGGGLISGTWKIMFLNPNNNGHHYFGVAVRVS